MAFDNNQFTTTMKFLNRISPWQRWLLVLGVIVTLLLIYFSE